MISANTKGYALATLAIASLASHAVSCIVTGKYLFAVIGVVIFPVGIIHGAWLALSGG